jgi:hypothetical protein
VINAGDIALVSGTDQRGLPRFVGGQADIGAVETNYALALSGGSPQTAVINNAFGLALQATVTESGNPLAGVTVTYTAPGSGASGVFGSSTTSTAVTDGSGVANSPAFTANNTVGSYNVTGGIGAAITPVNYALTNILCAINPHANIIVSNDPNSCGAVVNFTVTATGSCGAVTSFPASGTVFPKGTTTVTNQTASGATSTFTVTVNDTQAPSLVQPANINATTSGTATSVAVTYPAAVFTDN